MEPMEVAGGGGQVEKEAVSAAVINAAFWICARLQWQWQCDQILSHSYTGFCSPLFLNWFGKILLLICLWFLHIDFWNTSILYYLESVLFSWSCTYLAQSMGSVYSLLFVVLPVSLCLLCHCLSTSVSWNVVFIPCVLIPSFPFQHFPSYGLSHLFQIAYFFLCKCFSAFRSFEIPS